jgi:RNA-splicing ligase RtcB
MYRIKGKYTNADITIDNVEETCISQIISMVNHPAFTEPIVIMPDSHAGKGSVVGFTMPVGDKIVPNTIGVDISCGVLSFNIGKVNINCEELDQRVRDIVPFGMNVNKRSKIKNKFIGIEDTLNRIGINKDYFYNSIGTVGGG